jgi:hypothetical protein
MRLRRAVLQAPAKSSVPRGLPLNNRHPILNHSESTLPQLLIPPHFNFPRINTYKKPGGGCPPQDHKVLQLVTPHLSPRCAALVFSFFTPFNSKPSTFNAFSLSPFPAALTSRLQIVENKITLSPAVATLTDCVKHKSFVCNSCGKTRGWGARGGTANSSRSRGFFAMNLGCLSQLSHGTRLTDHGPRRPPWFTRTVAPHGAKCQNHSCYWLAARRETYPLPRCLIQRRADIGFGIRRLPNPVASRSQCHVMPGSHEQEGLGPPF